LEGKEGILVFALKALQNSSRGHHRVEKNINTFLKNQQYEKENTNSASSDEIYGYSRGNKK
jgi:hypothetical protein